MSDRDPERAAAVARADLCSSTPATPDQKHSETAAHEPPTSHAVAAADPASSAAVATVTAASAASSRANGSTVATGAAVAESATAASAAATSGAVRSLAPAPPAFFDLLQSGHFSSSSSSSSSAASLKKCACCHRLLPDGDYSGAQIKAKGKRQCKGCVAGLQKSLPEPRHSVAVVEGAARPGPPMPIHDISVCLSSALESDQLKGLTALIDVLSKPRGPNSGGTDISLSASTDLVPRVLRAAEALQTDEIRTTALECISHMAHKPKLLAQMVDAGVIPILVGLLQSREPALPANQTLWSVNAVALIARASHSNSEALLAAGALVELLSRARSNTPADLRDLLFFALTCLMRVQPAAEMADAVTQLGAMLMDSTSPPEILRVCLNTFADVLADAKASSSPSNFNQWVESVLNAAPGLPQRLVELAGDWEKLEVSEAALRLMVNCFVSDTNQLQQLFDCGLIDEISSILLCANATETMRHYAIFLCANAAGTESHALTLIDNDLVVQFMLMLLSMSESALLYYAVGFFNNVMRHRNRHIMRRMVQYEALKPLVAVLRRMINGNNGKPTTQSFLHSVSNMLTVGEAEAEDDERGINPYIEPLDWLGVFELADPLQQSADEEVAQAATRVFSYFIPNDCD